LFILFNFLPPGSGSGYELSIRIRILESQINADPDPNGRNQGRENLTTFLNKLFGEAERYLL
jgi:hypothetical protein